MELSAARKKAEAIMSYHKQLQSFNEIKIPYRPDVLLSQGANGSSNPVRLIFLRVLSYSISLRQSDKQGIIIMTQ